MSDVREQAGNDPGTELGEASQADAAAAPVPAAPDREVSAAREGSDDEARVPREARVRTSGGAEIDAEAGAGEESDDPENPLEVEAEIAADYLEELLDIADLDGDIDTYIEGERAHVSIVSDSEVLVGADGKVLDALQELTRLAVMTETGDRSRLMLDVAGFRDRRRAQLLTLAAGAVEEARTSQQAVPLAPMNPFERKIVHDAVAAAGLTSESEGEEPSRHVVVLPSA